MTPINQDTKWKEAKKIVGELAWLDVISCYREIGGKNVFVYAVGDGEKDLIVDIIDKDGTILLVDKRGNPFTLPYLIADKRRKVFSYSESSTLKTVVLNNKSYDVYIET